MEDEFKVWNDNPRGLRLRYLQLRQKRKVKFGGRYKGEGLALTFPGRGGCANVALRHSHPDRRRYGPDRTVPSVHREREAIRIRRAAQGRQAVALTATVTDTNHKTANARFRF
jgi:hypothetical protein